MKPLLRSKLAEIKKLSFFDTFKHASTFFTGTIAVQGLGILTLPIYTSYFTKAEYGIINVFTSLVAVVAVLLSCNLHASVQRYYFEKGKSDYKEFLGTILIAIHLIFGCLALLLYSQADWIARRINIPSNLIFWLIVMGYCTTLYIIFNLLMVATKQSKRYTLVQVVMQYSKFFLTLLGLVYLTQIAFEPIFMAKIVGECIVVILISLYILILLRKHISFGNLSFSYVKYALVYGLPLIPFTLSNYILTSFDQWFIISQIGQEEAGLYSFAYKIGMIYMGLGTALINGAAANYFKFMNSKNYEAVSSQVDSMTKLLVLGGGFLILYAIDAGTLLSGKEEFLAALPIAPVIIFSYLFWAIASFYNRGIFYEKRNIYLSIIVLLTGFINIGLNVYFIDPELKNYEVAAYTTLASYILMMCFSIYTTRYILKLPALPLFKILKYIVFLALVIVINYTFGNPNIGLHLGWITFKFILFLGLALLLYYDKIYILIKAKNHT